MWVGNYLRLRIGFVPKKDKYEAIIHTEKYGDVSWEQL